MITKKEPHSINHEIITGIIRTGTVEYRQRGLENISKKRSFSIQFPNFALINALVALSGPESNIDPNTVLNVCLSAYMEYLQRSLSPKDLNRLADAYRIAYQALIDENLPGLQEGFTRLDGASTDA